MTRDTDWPEELRQIVSLWPGSSIEIGQHGIGFWLQIARGPRLKLGETFPEALAAAHAWADDAVFMLRAVYKETPLVPYVEAVAREIEAQANVEGANPRYWMGGLHLHRDEDSGLVELLEGGKSIAVGREPQDLAVDLRAWYREHP